VCVASVAGAVWWRLTLAAPGRGRAAALAALAVPPLATGIFIYVGPLQPHWAKRAGTPPAILQSRTTRPGGRK
jgi:methionine sulfoxide reductase heme-binding subunit